MVWAKTTLDEVLTRLAARLVDQTDASADSCFVSFDIGEPPVTPGMSTGQYLQIYPESGQFSEAYIDGGGQAQCTMDLILAVKITDTQLLEQAGRSSVRLTNTTRGLVALVKPVLKALVAYMLTSSGGSEILRHPFIPSGIQFVPTEGAAILTFTASFDWDLS